MFDDNGGGDFGGGKKYDVGGERSASDRRNPGNVELIGFGCRYRSGCQPCPAGTYRSNVGCPSSGAGCPNGQWYDQQCINCPAGKIGKVSANGVSEAESCIAPIIENGQRVCPLGQTLHTSSYAYSFPTFTKTVHGLQSCVPCPSGTFGAVLGGCENCPAGSVNPESERSCSTCNPPYYAPRSGWTGTCKECPEGSYISMQTDNEGIQEYTCEVDTTGSTIAIVLTCLISCVVVAVKYRAIKRQAVANANNQYNADMDRIDQLGVMNRFYSEGDSLRASDSIELSFSAGVNQVEQQTGFTMNPANLMSSWESFERRFAIAPTSSVLVEVMREMTEFLRQQPRFFVRKEDIMGLASSKRSKILAESTGGTVDDHSIWTAEVAGMFGQLLRVIGEAPRCISSNVQEPVVDGRGLVFQSLPNSLPLVQAIPEGAC